MVRVKNLGGDFYAEKVTPRINLDRQAKGGWAFTVEFENCDSQFFTDPEGNGLFEIIDYKMVPRTLRDSEGNEHDELCPEPVVKQCRVDLHLSKDRRRALRRLRRHFTHWDLVDDREPTDSMKCGY